MSLPFRLSNIHNGDAVDIKRVPGAKVPSDQVATAPAAAAPMTPAPVTPAPMVTSAPVVTTDELVLSDEQRMQRMAALQEQERIAAARVEEENRAAEQRAREAQERKVREEEARRQEDEAIARRLQEKEAQMMAQWGVDDDSLMAHVAQQMKTATATPAEAAAAAAAAAAVKESEKEDVHEQADAKPAAPFDIDRVTVFMPTDKAVRPSELDDIPDDFYELTLDDLRAIKQAEQEAKQGNEGFMTREMRERKRQKKWSAFTTCSVRVRLPDRVEVMNQFSAAAHIADLYRFVRQCLVDTAPDFELYTTPPLTVLRNMNQNFVDSHLVPAAIVHLRWKGDAAAAGPVASSAVLRPDLVARMQSVAPAAPKQRAEDTTTTKKGAHNSSSTGAVCSVCLASNLRLCHCVECDNNFCLACWKTVHDPTENPGNAHHHMGQVPSPTAAAGQGGAGTGVRRTPPPATSDAATAAQQRGMPKWFRLGKKF